MQTTKLLKRFYCSTSHSISTTISLQLVVPTNFCFLKPVLFWYFNLAVEVAYVYNRLWQASLDGRSLELASSHSSDEDESGQHRRKTVVEQSSLPPTNIPLSPSLSLSRTPQPLPNLNIIANSELFQPIYAPRWPSHPQNLVVGEHPFTYGSL